MGSASGELLPLAVAIAISVTTIITTVLMLLSPEAKSRTVGLLVGCVVGVGGAVALFAFLADMLPTQDSGGSSLEASVIKMVVGVLLVVLALREWRGRPAHRLARYEDEQRMVFGRNTYQTSRKSSARTPTRPGMPCGSPG